jgi:hypothetical protein
MTQSPLSGVIAAQKAWAANQGYAVEGPGYLRSVSLNLFGGLSLIAKAAFLAADGGELSDVEGRPAKMRSLISSSALALNVFQYWALCPEAPIGKALGHSGTVQGIEFERRLPTGTGRKPANLDVVLTMDDGAIVGVESKFTEWMRPSNKQPTSIAPYVRNDRTLWDDAALTGAANLARAIRDGTETFKHLDVAQLLKHVLGLSRAARRGWALRYVWFDASGEAGNTHRTELDQFRALVGDELNFQAKSYQELAIEISHLPNVIPQYLVYLRDRYAFGLS